MGCLCFTAAQKRSSSKSRTTKSIEEILIQIPNATLHLVEENEATEISKGDIVVVRISEDNIPLAKVIKINNDIQWPLTKDEPVVKLDQTHYLFTIPSKDGNFLSYGVSFKDRSGELERLDSFLKENSCFSAPISTEISSSSTKDKDGIYWRDYAPRIESYNGVLAKAIAGGTGEIVKGIFKCSNAYARQVHKGGDIMRTPASNTKGEATSDNTSKVARNNDNSGVKKNIKRVRKLSRMTEKMSKSLLDGVMFASGSVTAPLIRSQAGKAFLAMVPGEVLLASLDAINKIMDAAEAAERQAFSATSSAVTKAVSRRFGEDAGEVTEDVIATTGHAVGTAWNVFKIRKAINPASSVSAAAVKNAVKNRR